MRSSGRDPLPSGWRALVAAALLGVVACGGPSEESLERGDRLLGAGELESAIAEYKLALRQGGESAPVLLRLGQAYARHGDVEETIRYYEPLLETDSSHMYQMAGDLIGLARDALARGARENVARALRPLLEVSVGLVPVDLRLALARHYWQDGDYAAALPLYLSSLTEGGEEIPAAVHFETGRAYEEMGGCLEALEYFSVYLEAAARDAPQVPSARWHYGSCLFEMAETDHAAGRPRAALEKLDRMVRLGVPQTLLDRAHFLRGELLLAMGEQERALDAYREVLRLNPTRSGSLVQQAEGRIRQIRFGYR